MKWIFWETALVKKSDNKISVMLLIGAIFVLKEKLWASYLMPESSFIWSVRLDLLTFHILKLFAHKNFSLEWSILK